MRCKQYRNALHAATPEVAVGCGFLAGGLCHAPCPVRSLQRAVDPAPGEAALQGWPSSPQEGQLLAAGGAQYLAPTSPTSNAASRDSQVVHDFHAALGRSSDLAVAVAAIKVGRRLGTAAGQAKRSTTA